MNTATTDILQVIEIANPCQADWECMEGDEQSRFCGQCSKRVYNLSAMTSDEAVKLISESESTPCIRLYRRQDGTVINQDCPVGIRRAYRWAKRVGVAVFVALLGGSTLFAATKMTNVGKSTYGSFLALIASFLESEPEFYPEMGEMIACPGPPVHVVTTPPSVPMPETLND